MLNSNEYDMQQKHQLIAQQVEIKEAKELSEESLNGAVNILKQQAEEYNKAGLTQISNWL